MLRVEEANLLCDWVIEKAFQLHAKHQYFVIENPLRSYLWHFPRAKDLLRLVGAEDVDHSSCCFEPGRRRKLQRVRTNLRGL